MDFPGYSGKCRISMRIVLLSACTFGALAQTGADFSISRIEAVQVVQNEDHTVPIIAGKRTAVRVFLRKEGEADEVATSVRCSLAGRRDGQLLLGSPLTAAAIQPKNTPRRDMAGHSVQFVLPESWTAGRLIELEATIEVPAGRTDRDASNNSLRREVQFLETGSTTQPWTIEYLRGCDQSDTELATLHDLLLKLFPLQPASLLYRAIRAPCLAGDSTAVRARASEFALYLPSSIVVSPRSGFHLAHTVAQALGLRHPNTADACGATDPATDWRFEDIQERRATARILDPGFDPVERQLKPPDSIDLLSHCAPNRVWISEYSYRRLLESGLNLPLPDNLSDEDLILAGSIRRDGSHATLLPSFRAPAAVREPEGAANHVLRFSEGPNTLAEYPLAISFQDHFTGQAIEEEHFAVRVPFPARATKVALLRDGIELATLELESDDPVVSITSPSSGTRWDGGSPQSIAWTGSHPSKLLAYALLYSSDRGRTWHPLLPRTEDTSLEIDPAVLTGGPDTMIRVVASSGLRNHEATVGPFLVAQTPRFEVSSTDLQYRKVVVGTGAEQALQLRNSGNGPLSITQASASSPDYQLSPSGPMEIPAGAERTVRVRLDPASPGDMTARLSFRTNVTTQPVTDVTLAGRAIAAPEPDLDIAPLNLEFGDINPNQNRDLAVTLQNYGPGMLLVTGVTANNPRFSLVSPAVPFLVAVGVTQPLVVRFAPTAGGVQRGELRVTTNDPGRPFVTIRLNGRGTGPEPSLNPSPTITSLLPTSIVAGSPLFTLTVNGAGFVRESVIEWNGTARPTTFVSSAQLVTPITAIEVASTGAASITVFTPLPGGGRSAAVSFPITTSAPPPPVTNPVPVIITLSPSSATAGNQTFTVTVTGQGFVNGSVLEWNGSPRTATVLSSSQLSATITAEDIASAVDVNITVFNPLPGGGRSTPVAFRVTPAPITLVPPPATPTILLHQIDTAGCPDVAVQLSVLDTRLASVTRLLPTNLSCREDNQPITCIIETPPSKPLSLMLVLGLNGVSAEDGDMIKGVAMNIVNGLGVEDRAAVVHLERTVNPIQSFTSSKAALNTVINSLREVGPGNALFDSVSLAANATAAERGRRQIVLVFTAQENLGGDLRDSTQALSRIMAAGVSVFSIAHGPGANNVNLVTFLRQLATQTHARTFQEAASFRVQSSVDTILRQLQNSHTATFLSPTFDGRPHEFSFTYSSGGLAGTARRTYPGCR